MLNQSFDKIFMFQVIAESGEIAGAARKLGLTPSAVSQALKKFEREMGGQLFLREYKKIILTPIGRRLLNDVGPLLGKLTQLLENYSQELDNKSPIGTLRVGAPTEIGSGMLVKAIGIFQEKYPRMKVQLKFAAPHTLLKKVSTGELDFCLCAETGKLFEGVRSLSLKKIFDEELVLVGHKDLLGIDRLGFNELIELPHLDYTIAGSSSNLWYQFYFKKTPKQLPVTFVAENALALLEGVKAKMGLAVVPINRFRPQDLKNIVTINPSKKKLLNPILLIQHVDKIPGPAEKALIEIIQTFRDQRL